MTSTDVRQPTPLPLAAVAQTYVRDAAPNLTLEQSTEMDNLISQLISGSVTYPAAIDRSIQLIESSKPIEKLHAILTVTDQPLRASITPRIHIANCNIHRKNKLWTEYEDVRLLAGIHKFGLGNWGSIARFIGNNRTKAQSCQRWCRGLDPRISKASWSEADDRKLEALVERFGQKAWTRIALEFGNRCDVQCRYRFTQLQQAHFSRKPISEESEKSSESPTVEVRRRAKTLLPSIHTLIAGSDFPGTVATETTAKIQQLPWV
jgi:hypothetical protein